MDERVLDATESSVKPCIAELIVVRIVDGDPVARRPVRFRNEPQALAGYVEKLDAFAIARGVVIRTQHGTRRLMRKECIAWRLPNLHSDRTVVVHVRGRVSERQRGSGAM